MCRGALPKVCRLYDTVENVWNSGVGFLWIYLNRQKKGLQYCKELN